MLQLIYQLKLEIIVPILFHLQQVLDNGDNLSPTLFNIFINDITAYIDSSCDPVKLTQRHINCLLYADDLILLSNSAEGLQNCMEKLSTFCDEWGMNVNFLGKSCSFCLPRVPFVNCRQFMYLFISLLVLRAGYGI